jgi:hypothetical protein
MASLKLIADEISDALNRPFDDMLKERIKSIFRHELAAMIRQQINKHGISDHFVSNFQTTCIQSSPLINITYNSENVDNWFRTEFKIPNPIRYTTDDPFMYVGTTDRSVPFIYTKLSEFAHVGYLPIIQQAYQMVVGQTKLKTPARYFYVDGYIYIYAENIDEFEPIILNVEGIFVGNPNQVENGISFDDTVEFPMPEDMIQLVKERLLKGELSIIDDKDKIKSEHIDNN